MTGSYIKIENGEQSFTGYLAVPEAGSGPGNYSLPRNFWCECCDA